MKESEKFLTVLTGTITPSPGVTLLRTDPILRRADYLQAFRFWLEHPDSRLRSIVFVENSGADLSDFHRSAENSGKQVEILSMPKNPTPAGMHYGYSEMGTLDQALTVSRLRRETSHMIKVTGRLVFPSLPQLLDRLPPNPRAVVDARARLPFRPSGNGFVCTQLFIASHEFYDARLRKSYLALRHGDAYPHMLEHAFFDVLVTGKREAGVLLRFPVNCEPVGISGFSGQSYRSFSRSLIAQARAICRTVAPDFWL